MILIVGVGAYGCTVAQILIEAGCDVMVIDRRSHIGGNCYDVPEDQHFIGRYGAHIFHTSNREIWEYVNRFSRWRLHYHYAKCRGADGRVYTLPFSVQTLYEVYGDDWNHKWERSKTPCERPVNLEEYCLAHIGEDLFALLVKEYTEKHWGRKCRTLPASIISRLPIRMSWDTCYFNDEFMGMPAQGYTALFAAMLAGALVETEVDYFEHRDQFRDVEHVFYSGPLDRFFDCDAGELDYRSLRWEHDPDGSEQYCPMMNYATTSVPYTRTWQWSRFYGQAGGTVTKEYPAKYDETGEPLYPIRDAPNSAVAKRYLARVPAGFTFGGRLATYRYYDMHQVIAQARQHAQTFLRRRYPLRA